MPKLTPPSPAEPEFDYRHYLPAGIETFTVPWLAMWFGTTDRHWINLIESGAIRAANLKTPNASKTMYRVPRAELISYLNRTVE